MTSPARPTFLFDADCGPCQDGTDLIKRRIAPAVDFVPRQSADLDGLGVSRDECLVAPVLVRGDGSHVAGRRAMAEMLGTAGSPYRQVGALMSAPGVAQVLDRAMPFMYRNRHRLPGATDACRVA